MELEEALQKVRAGDKEAYAEVIEQTERRLRTFLGLRLADRDLVDELAQQAYITVYEKLEEYRSGTQFETWLRQIAFFHLRNALRSRRTANLSALERLAQLAAPAFSDGMELQDDVDRLSRCLERVPTASRRMLDLRYRECLDPAEIASRTGNPAATVRSSLTRIRQMLRKCMEAHHAG